MNGGSVAEPFRVGLIGYGLAGACFHAPFITATPGLHLHAIVTRDPERQRQVARDHPEARIVDSADLLWRDPHGLDLVVVASVNSSHVPLARAAIAAGAAVVVDKPLAATAAYLIGSDEDSVAGSAVSQPTRSCRSSAGSMASATSRLMAGMRSGQ